MGQTPTSHGVWDTRTHTVQYLLDGMETRVISKLGLMHVAAYFANLKLSFRSPRYRFPCSHFAILADGSAYTCIDNNTRTRYHCEHDTFQAHQVNPVMKHIEPLAVLER